MTTPNLNVGPTQPNMAAAARLQASLGRARGDLPAFAEPDRTEDSSTSPGSTEASSPDATAEADPSTPAKPKRSESRQQELANRVRQLEAEKAARDKRIRELEQKTAAARFDEVVSKVKVPDDATDIERAAVVGDQVAQHRLDEILPPEQRQELREALIERQVRRSIPGMDDDQVAAVTKVLDRFDNGISPEEARAIAAVHDPDLFEQRARPKAFPQGHQPARGMRQAPQANDAEADALRKRIRAYGGRAPKHLVAQLLARSWGERM